MSANAKMMIENLQARASEHVMLVSALAAMETAGGAAADILASAHTVLHHAEQSTQMSRGLVKLLTPPAPAPAPGPTPTPIA